MTTLAIIAGVVITALAVLGALTLLGAILAAQTRRRTPVTLTDPNGRHLHYIRGLPGHTHYVHASDVCWCRNPITANEDGHRA